MTNATAKKKSLANVPQRVTASCSFSFFLFQTDVTDAVSPSSRGGRRVFDKSEVNSWLEDSLVRKDLLSLLNGYLLNKENEYEMSDDDVDGERRSSSCDRKSCWTEELKCHLREEAEEGRAAAVENLEGFIRGKSWSSQLERE